MAAVFFKEENICYKNDGVFHFVFKLNQSPEIAL